MGLPVVRLGADIENEIEESKLRIFCNNEMLGGIQSFKAVK